MASTHGLSARLHTMEARLDYMADTNEQLRIHMHHMGLVMNESAAINRTMLDMLYKLQPLANYLSPLSNVLNPRESSARDSGMGDMEPSTIEEVSIETEINDTCSVSAPPAPLRRRRGRSNLKRISNITSTSKAAEAEVAEVALTDDRSEIITVSMMQDVAQRT